ncbi:MAG TPA: NAD-dependent epimerase/dehydratase family protein [Bryobacteraceae bacterium]|jgi:nucleoside-diphosphate-sugar epimerase
MANRPARVLVLGATGHIGQAVVRRALKNGDQVTAATRRAHPEGFDGLPVKIVQIDGGFRSLPELAEGHDLLVDAAAPYPLGLGVPGTRQWRCEVDAAVKRTELVIDAARRHHLRLAYVSSCTTLPRREAPQGSAAAVWRRSISPYFEAKAAMERTVIAAAREGLPAVIVNPAAFLGPWEFRAVEGSFVRLVLERRLPMVIDQPMCVIDVRDVADAIDRALARELFGRPIPLAGHNIGLPQLAVLTARLAGLPSPPPLPLDGHAVSAAAFWAEAACKTFGIAPPPALGFIPLIADVLPMQPSPEQMDLGIRIRPLEETLRDSLAFHRARSFA